VSIPPYLILSDNPRKTIDGVIARFQPDKVAVLVDENTRQYCLPLLELSVPVIEIKSGEQHKNIHTCTEVWKALTDFQFTRNSLLINLGGGVIGDLGGFAAATFKRGIRFVQMPTTLLSMVDASIGGKLGVDFNGLKNHIGVFQLPGSVIVWDGFLRTLSKRELRSGFAEMLKHGLISDAQYWNELKSHDFNSGDWKNLIQKSVEIKGRVVEADPMEQGLRKILNFGHTIGHAIESALLETGDALLHGEAIAAGMVMEAHLSFQRGMLSQMELDGITDTVRKIFGGVKLPEGEKLIALIQQDKKNRDGRLNFSLLAGIGKSEPDQPVNRTEIELSFSYYEQAIR
jgi:3-dehydroquinate synthase